MYYLSTIIVSLLLVVTIDRINCLTCYMCNCEHEITNDNCHASQLPCTLEYRNGSYCEISRDLISIPGVEIIFVGHVQQEFVPYKHFVNVEEELILYRNLTWDPPSVSLISYICDWDLCNDPRLTEKLTTTFQFVAGPSQIAGYILGSGPPDSCVECTICSNTTDFNTCANVSCPSGQCFIDDYIDNPEFDDCVYAFQAECEPAVLESSIIITATYSIDDDELVIDEVDLYCSKSNCNTPQTVNTLIGLINTDIQLDSGFYFRPLITTTSSPSTASQTTTPPPSTASQTITGPFSFIMIATFCLFFIVF
jgi:hypothetical protein